MIHGRLLEQDYEPIPEVGLDEILIRWPWRLTLRVDEVALGAFSGQRLEAIGIQHTAIREGYGRTFLLGRDGGGYRLLTISPRRLSRRHELVELAGEVDSHLCPEV